MVNWTELGTVQTHSYMVNWTGLGTVPSKHFANTFLISGTLAEA